MRRRVVSVSALLISDMELYVLAKEGVVTITKSEFDELPLETIQHLIGFSEGRKELERETQEAADRKSRARTAVTRYG